MKTVVEEVGSKGLIMHYEMCLQWKNNTTANEIKDMISKRDCVDLIVENDIMYFPDKFTYDHICYHYVCKITPDRRPNKLFVADLKSVL